MRVTTIGSEKTIDKLVTRLYGSAISDAKRRVAINALTQANPQLDATLRKGTAVVVPDARDMPLLKRANVSDAPGELAQRAATVLAAFRESLAIAAKARADEATAEGKLLKSAAMKRLIKQFPALEADVARVAEAIKRRQAEAKEVLDLVARGLAESDERPSPGP